MVLDGLRGYLQLANGLTDVTRERARAAAKNLLAQGEAGVGAVLPGNVRSLTDDLIATSKANRDLLMNLVHSEVERSVTRLGLASADELDSAARRVRRLEDRLADMEVKLREASAAQRASAAARTPAAKQATAKKSTAKKSTAKKSSSQKATASKSTGKKATGKKATQKATRKATAKTSSGATA